MDKSHIKIANILSLSSTEAKDFFMKSEQYHGFDSLDNFTFDEDSVEWESHLMNFQI